MVNVSYESLHPSMLSSPFPGLAVSTPSLHLQVSLHPNRCSRVYICMSIHIYFNFGHDEASLRRPVSLSLCSGFLQL